jgi:hypothetical protein
MAVDLKGLSEALNYESNEASIKDGTSNTVFFAERYGDPVTFTYTVTSAGGAIAGVIIAATTDNNTSDFDCSELTQWASHQASSDTDIGGFIIDGGVAESSRLFVGNLTMHSEDWML